MKNNLGLFLAKRAHLNPRLEAFVDTHSGRRFTFAELDARANQVAVVLRDAGLPMLVTHGTTDDAWPAEEQREMAERLGATYTVIAGSGHSPAVDDPETTSDVLCDFWKRAELLTT